jgi:hypothetical protein
MFLRRRRRSRQQARVEGQSAGRRWPGSAGLGVGYRCDARAQPPRSSVAVPVQLIVGTELPDETEFLAHDHVRFVGTELARIVGFTEVVLS